MKLVLQTKLHMAGGCFKVAYDPEFRPVWENQTPLAFGLEIERLRALYDELNARSAKVKVTGPGAREAKLAVENELCGLAHVMAQAVAFHAKKAGQVERAAQADLSRSDVQRGSMQQRVDIAAAILDLASSAADQPGASDSGITRENVDLLKDALNRYKQAMLLPRQQIVNRSSTLEELDDKVAGLLDDLSGLDGLILQFGRTESGHRFIHAWRRARMIVGPATHPLPSHAEPPPPTPGLPKAA